MNESTYIYQLKATLDNPFGDGTIKRYTSIYYKTREGAEQRIEKFRSMLVDIFKLRDTHTIDIVVLQHELID